MLDIALNF